MRRPSTHLLLPLLALALLGSAHALDGAGLAPALEAAFPVSVSYLDCPFASAARTCVLVPDASGVRAADRAALAFLRARPGVEQVRKDGAEGYTFHAGDTVYRLAVAPSRARPGLAAATLSFTFDEGSATHAVCLQPNALFDFARLPSLTPAQYAAMATAVTCHGADPTDPQGRTPLFDAVRSGNLAAVRTLLRGGADPNHIADSGWTPLLTAARLGTRPILDALLQAGGDTTYIAPDGAAIASLEPFNPHLAAAAGVPGGDAVLPELPGSLPAGGTLALARPAARSPRPARAAAVSPPTQAASAPGDAAGPAPAAAPARGRSAPLAWLPLTAAALALVVTALMLRLRARAPERHETLRHTGTEWRPPARPEPLKRRRSARRLEPANPWNDPLV